MADTLNAETTLQSPSRLSAFRAVRQRSMLLAEGLSAEDLAAQSMADASPGKWHLAHTSWFFEKFILREQSDYQCFNPVFDELFNSYYLSVGQPYARPQRGLITRPSLQEVLDYRAYVDEYMVRGLERGVIDDGVMTVGLHHEMQHQELFLTDLLHLFSHNPLKPAVKKSDSHRGPADAAALQWQTFDEQIIPIGAGSEGFSYDCERPNHRHLLSAFALATRPINNAEWLEFMSDGGYTTPLLWLSDGWACLQKTGWRAPAYWQQADNEWQQFGLDGLQTLDPKAPVTHISYYEAQAFAHWAGKRLPREQELEFIAQQTARSGNFLEQERWRPCASSGTGMQQIYGDVWEWTQSAFLPYPGFVAEQGALGEYNGKFMSRQFVLKGGSCVTPIEQMRASYRNFFYPHQRWQFTGLRLASDV